MKRGMGILIAAVVVLIVGGGLTSQLAGVPLIVQTDTPDASVFTATPEQAAQIFILVGIVLSNVVILGGLIAGLFWWLNRSVVRSRVEAEEES